MSVIARIVHHRRWERVGNHMDARHCPWCGASVHGNRGQRLHQEFHERFNDDETQLQELLGELRKRTGMAEEAVEVGQRWTAAVDGFNALEGPGDDDG